MTSKVRIWRSTMVWRCSAKFGIQSGRTEADRASNGSWSGMICPGLNDGHSKQAAPSHRAYRVGYAAALSMRGFGAGGLPGPSYPSAEKDKHSDRSVLALHPLACHGSAFCQSKATGTIDPHLSFFDCSGPVSGDKDLLDER